MQLSLQSERRGTTHSENKNLIRNFEQKKTKKRSGLYSHTIGCYNAHSTERSQKAKKERKKRVNELLQPHYTPEVIYINKLEKQTKRTEYVVELIDQNGGPEATAHAK